ncbi:MAG: NADH-quinone oxidoreductase subunit D [Chloroflexota bacterium]|nr:NADH-quinone oxidoreductase subunit D [Chloroflexota bacterium]
MAEQTQVRSLDDPEVFVETPATIYDAVPPYPPRTEREAEFYTLADGEMLINLGPQHPSTHGVLRVVLKIDGERIVDLDPVLGYLHRGVEKICENGDWHHAISNCDPLEYVASMFSEAMPVLACEKLLDLQVPGRAEYIRVLAWELNRIASHGLFMGWLALDLGGLTPILYGFIERDEIVEMLAALTGQRLLFNYLRIGGVNGDLNHEFMSRLGDWMGHAAKRLDDQQRLLNENEIFLRRTRGLGKVDRRTALRMCLTGPPLRATGIPYDVRRAHPYSVYPELEFQIPTREEGDSFARYMLHLDEVKQSIHIIDQVLHQMPDGPCMAGIPRLIRPRPGRAWVAIESPRGQYGCYAMSDGTDQPFRLRIHDPSYFNLQIMGHLMPGNLIADTMAVMASLDPIMGGIDK